MADTKIEEKDLQEAHEAVAALREAKGDLEKFQKASAALDKYEEKNQALVKQLANAEKAQEELKDRFSALETELARPRGSMTDQKELALIQAKEMTTKYAAGGMEAVMKYKADNKIEHKDLRTDIGPNGGFLVTPEYMPEIIKNITEISPILSLARTRTISSTIMDIPIRTSNLVASWYGETETATTVNQSYGLESLKMHYMTVPVDISRQLVNSAEFNMDTEISTDVAEAIAKTSGTGYVNGTGVKQPNGFMQDTRITSIVTTISGNLTMDEVRKLNTSVKSGYWPRSVYGFNRRTLHEVRKLKTGAGDYLWQPSITGSTPATLDGFQYVEIPDMPDVASSAYPIIFGDFRSAYMIGLGSTMEMVRDEVTQATKSMVRFVFYHNTGGQVIKPEALVKLQVAA